MKIIGELGRGLSLLGVVLLEACGGATISTGNAPIVPQVANVFVAGYELNSAGVKVAMVWKNGVGTSLSDGVHGAYASAVAISNSDVYVAGLVNNGSNDVATEWKNGVATSLTDGTLEANVSGVAISGTDVYVSGGEYGANSQNNYVNSAGYWKNGAFNQLASVAGPGPGAGQMLAISVYGSDVYVAGELSVLTTNGTTQVQNPAAVYWKNGTPFMLTNGSTFAQATSIVINGSDVYIGGGMCLTLDPDCQEAAYWKNGTLVDLTAATPSVVSGIAISGGTVYASGDQSSSSGTLAEYWTGTTSTLLYNSTTAAANGIATLGSDVYVVGAQIGGACYWKNGFLYSVTGGEYPSAGYAIAVVQP